VTRDQHSTTLRASPPNDVSLYLSCISAPVSRIVLMQRRGHHETAADREVHPTADHLPVLAVRLEGHPIAVKTQGVQRQNDVGRHPEVDGMSAVDGAAARMAPTVCELDGPIPIENRSKTLTGIAEDLQPTEPDQGFGSISTLGGLADGSGCEDRRTIENASAPAPNAVTTTAASSQGRLLRRLGARAS
jgi:hypothetical protein